MNYARSYAGPYQPLALDPFPTGGAGHGRLVRVGADAPGQPLGVQAIPGLAIGAAVNAACIGLGIYAGRSLAHTHSLLGDAVSGSLGLLAANLVAYAFVKPGA